MRKRGIFGESSYHAERCVYLKKYNIHRTIIFHFQSDHTDNGIKTAMYYVESRIQTINYLVFSNLRTSTPRTAAPTTITVAVAARMSSITIPSPISKVGTRRTASTIPVSRLITCSMIPTPLLLPDDRNRDSHLFIEFPDAVLRLS